jgi:molecular chaperone GrpE
METEPANPNPAPGADPESPGTEPAAAAAASLEPQFARLRQELDDLNAKYLRTLADYQNSQRRHAANEREARLQGATAVVLSILTVMDHFDLALAQDPATTTAERIIAGVRVIRDELAKALQAHGVTTITAEPNDPFDPTRHEAVMQQAADGVEPGHVAATLQAGYALGERVIRPAKVAVAPAT